MFFQLRTHEREPRTTEDMLCDDRFVMALKVFPTRKNDTHLVPVTTKSEDFTCRRNPYHDLIE